PAPPKPAAAPQPPAPPAPPKPAAAPQQPSPPAPPKQNTPAAPRPSNAPPPTKRRPQGKKRRPAPKGRPQGKKRRPAPKKGKPGQPPIGKKRGGRIKIKLGLRAKKMSEETDEYTDQIGWTTSGAETVLSDLKDIEEVTKKEPETLTHHCSMCGSRMQIPRPKRERYRVICAHPECGHEDRIGF
ncbi:MAG: hypothetical protein P8Q46_06635, partial [Candidatus Thalassarchaeaceae archaeon]|nr:hypothetical protein [Candidatus Thalassarchaeaceae archaeon]